MKENYDVTEIGIKAERFFKKYKFIIIFIIIFIIAAFAYNQISTSYKEHAANAASELYFKALKGDKTSLNELKDKNINLYAAAKIALNESLDVSNIDALLKDLDAIKSNSSSVFLKDLNTLKKAYAELKNNNPQAAHRLAKEINNNSEFYALAQAILHIKAEQ